MPTTIELILLWRKCRILFRQFISTLMLLTSNLEPYKWRGCLSSFNPDWLDHCWLPATGWRGGGWTDAWRSINITSTRWWILIRQSGYCHRLCSIKTIIILGLKAPCNRLVKILCSVALMHDIVDPPWYLLCLIILWKFSRDSDICIKRIVLAVYRRTGHNAQDKAWLITKAE